MLVDLRGEARLRADFIAVSFLCWVFIILPSQP